MANTQTFSRLIGQDMALVVMNGGSSLPGSVYLGAPAWGLVAEVYHRFCRSFKWNPSISTEDQSALGDIEDVIRSKRIGWTADIELYVEDSVAWFADPSGPWGIGVGSYVALLWQPAAYENIPASTVWLSMAGICIGVDLINPDGNQLYTMKIKGGIGSRIQPTPAQFAAALQATGYAGAQSVSSYTAMAKAA